MPYLIDAAVAKTVVKDKEDFIKVGRYKGAPGRIMHQKTKAISSSTSTAERGFRIRDVMLRNSRMTGKKNQIRLFTFFGSHSAEQNVDDVCEDEEATTDCGKNDRNVFE